MFVIIYNTIQYSWLNFVCVSTTEHELIKLLCIFSGPNVKKAKFFLAKAAIQGLYGVDSTFEATATN